MDERNYDDPVALQTPARKAIDPIEEFYRWAEDDVRRQLAIVQRFVSYSELAQYEDAAGELRMLSVGKFLALVRLAALDTFSPEVTTENKGLSIGLRKDYEQGLDVLRNHPVYPKIIEKLLKGLNVISGADSVTGWSDAMRRLAPAEVAAQMLGAAKTKDRLNAAAQFMDRLEPKRTRGEGGSQVVVIFPPGQEEIARGTHDLMKQIDGAVDGGVSAKVLNVPAVE